MIRQRWRPRTDVGQCARQIQVGQGADKQDLQADIRRLMEDAGSRAMRLIEVEGFIAPFCGLGADAIVLADYGKVKGALSKTPLARVAPGPLSYILATTTRSIPGFSSS